MGLKILLVDDHAIVRQGLRAILEGEPGLEIVGEADTARRGVDLVVSLCPDIVVMDVAMPDMNGVEATRKITARDNKVRVVALSAYAEKQFVTAMIEAGASGYVLKAGASDELLAALRAVAQGKKYLSPGIAHVVVDGFVGRLFPTDIAGQTSLGAREREVLQLLAEGHTSREIAARLSISEHTVEVHRRNIMKKLDIHSVAELTKYAVREGISPL